MPLKKGVYISPTWVNTEQPTIGQTELNLVSNVIEGSQIRIGDKVISLQSAKTNYLVCDGSTISGSTYPELVELLNSGGATADLPNESVDFGNVFIRAL